MGARAAMHHRSSMLCLCKEKDTSCVKLLSTIYIVQADMLLIVALPVDGFVFSSVCVPRIMCVEVCQFGSRLFKKRVQEFSGRLAGCSSRTTLIQGRSHRPMTIFLFLLLSSSVGHAILLLRMFCVSASFLSEGHT
mmetsp:Transcript_8347/g.13820  ORF Transcript_8347/g.13820 Transcript_8347/m.13820 type:complete len:136 (+) Transcript_8347:626-1033(+)